MQQRYSDILLPIDVDQLESDFRFCIIMGLDARIGVVLETSMVCRKPIKTGNIRIRFSRWMQHYLLLFF